MAERMVSIQRRTKETEIELKLNLDGSGQCTTDTGIGFFDHMLQQFACHGFFDVDVTCKGDLHIDTHHTVEDVGIALGQAIKEAAGDKKGIRRSGFSVFPMDDVLMLCAVDLSGRPYFVTDLAFTVERLGNFETELFNHFLDSMAKAAGMNLHLKRIFGENNHHLAEAAMKSFGKAMDAATSFDTRVEGVWSTKGIL